MTWRSLSHYWEDMGGDPELELVDDELAQRAAQAEAEAVAMLVPAAEDEKDLPF